MFNARSIIYYPGYINSNELSDEVVLPSYVLNNLINQYEINETLYITLTNVDTEQSYLATIGTSHNYDRNTIYVPDWILELLGYNGEDDDIILRIAKADISECPVATKIIIKPLDPVAFEIDTVSCFEKAFMNLHSIKDEITMAVPVPELGEDYLLYAYIQKVEPASLSRIIQSEVSVEFINEFEEKPEIPIYNPSLAACAPPLAPSAPPLAVGATTCAEATEATTTDESPIFQETAEERRRKVREAWLKRTQNTAK